MKNVSKELWRQGTWRVVFNSDYCDNSRCIRGPHGTGAVIIAEHEYRARRCWHMKRRVLRNRTTTECVALAMQFVLEQIAKERLAEQQAEIACEEAQALAEFAREFAV